MPYDAQTFPGKVTERATMFLTGQCELHTVILKNCSKKKNAFNLFGMSAITYSLFAESRKQLPQT